MVRERDWLMAAGAVVFAAGAGVVLVAIARGDDHLVLVGVVGLVAAAVCLAIGAWRSRSRVDWRRVETEQRLWASGPLGRAWLKLRQALLGR